jgi:hypothetical protein
LCEQRFIRFDTEAWYKRVTAKGEKTTQEQSEAREAYREFMRLHGRERMNRNSDGSRWRFPVRAGTEARNVGGENRLAQRLLCIGLVQASLGQNSIDSSKELKRALKPLALFSVYISTESKTP